MIQKIKKIIKLLMLRTPVVHLNITYSKPNERFLGHNVMVTGGSSGHRISNSKGFFIRGCACVDMCTKSKRFG